MSKYDSVYVFIKQYEPFGDILYFNSIQEMVGNSSLNAIGQDDVLTTFTDDTKERRLTFSLVQVRDFDESGHSDINVDALDGAEAFADWIETQNSARNFPILGDGCTVQQMAVAQSPYIGGVTDNNLAKYVIQIQILYTEVKQ